jgi:hypothetical protein
LGVIGTAGRTVGGVGDTTDVDEDEVIGGEKFSPPGLPAVEDFGGHEGFEVFMVGKDLDGVT